MMSNYIEIKVESGESLLEALLKDDRMEINPSCGGHGTCARCMVKCEGGHLSDISVKERLRIRQQTASFGYRLACLAQNKTDHAIYIKVYRVDMADLP